MNKPFENILDRLDEEREISYADFDLYVNEYSPCLDSEYDDLFHRGLERASRLVREAAEEYKKETYFNLDHVTLHKCPKCGGNTQHRVNQKGSWACGCFECGLFKSDYDHQKAIQEWEDYCKEYNNGWIPCSERLPEEHDSIFAKYKGTDKWDDNMFEKTSDEVNVTVSDRYGSLVTTHSHTVDGKWYCDLLKINKSYQIIAWQPLPQPYKESTDEQL